jgi:Mn2+/Fe2+ NRAMP family transporter
VANVGTLCAEFAGIAAAFELVGGVSRYVSVPLAGLLVAFLVMRGSFHRVEHVLLALSALFVAYIAAGILAHPDWAQAGRGLVVPSIPSGRDAILAVVAVVGTTLAPWGLVFIQSYAVDKKLKIKDLRFERVDVVTGAVLTGVIGFFVVIACAATLHKRGVHISDAGDAAQALRPLAGDLAAQLFGAGFLGAALLGIAIVPLSTAYSVAETFDRPCDLDLPVKRARLFYGTYGGALLIAGGVLLIPGIPLIDVLYLSQALNAVLLLAILPFLRRVALDPVLMGQHRLGRPGALATGLVLLLVAASVVALGVLSLAT